MATIDVNGNTLQLSPSGGLGQGHVPDLATLKALPSSILSLYLRILVTNYNGGDVPADYVYYTGIPGAIDGEPNVVLADDNSGYYLLLAASPVSANT